MYLLLTHTRSVIYNMTDPSSRQGERPRTNKTANLLATTKIWSWVPEGLNAKTGWLTVSCKVTLTLTLAGWTNWYSWSFRPQISPIRETQRDCRLDVKTVRTDRGWEYISSSARSHRKQSPRRNWAPWHPKLINTPKLSMAHGTDGIPQQCLSHLSRRSLVHITHLFNRCFRMSHFTQPWKEANVITLPTLISYMFYVLYNNNVKRACLALNHFFVRNKKCVLKCTSSFVLIAIAYL
jgi:hypothetical protein